MSADITPKTARRETIENLVGMANQYRAGTGAHTVVVNEINRREDWRKKWRNLFFIVLASLVSLIFWWLRS